MKRFKWIFAGIGALLAMIAVFGVVVMLLWNALVPTLFNLPVLNYWQAAGLLLLARILLGGFGHGFHGGGRERQFHHGNKLRERWLNMSEEERKEFIEKEKELFKFNKHRFHNFFDGDGEKDENE